MTIPTIRRELYTPLTRTLVSDALAPDAAIRVRSMPVSLCRETSTLLPVLSLLWQGDGDGIEEMDLISCVSPEVFRQISPAAHTLIKCPAFYEAVRKTVSDHEEDRTFTRIHKVYVLKGGALCLPNHGLFEAIDTDDGSHAGDATITVRQDHVSRNFSLLVDRSLSAHGTLQVMNDARDILAHLASVTFAFSNTAHPSLIAGIRYGFGSVS